MSESTTPAAPLIGGRYRELEKIGSGGMSVVLKAEDTTLQRTVALKMLAEHLAGDQDFVTRFRHEALAVARLQHPNIVQVFDSGSDTATHRHFIVMEYVEGTPLSDMLRGGQKLEPPRAVAIANATLAAAIALGLRLWLAGLVLGLIGHAAAIWAAKRDPMFVEIVRRHLRYPSHMRT